VIGANALLAAFVAGVLTSASPCVLAAVPVAVGYVGGQSHAPGRTWLLSTLFVVGLDAALVVMGLFAARFGTFLGTLPGAWAVTVGLIILVFAALLAIRDRYRFTICLPSSIQQRLAGAGPSGALVLGALIGTVMSPCATPALAAALVLAGTGNAFGASMWSGAALLLMYGLGHSVLLLIVGAMPAHAASLLARFARAEAWLPGRRAFALVLAVAAIWWIATGLGWAV